MEIKKIGLAAGAGELPLEFIRAVKSRGIQVPVFAVNGVTSPDIEKEADKVYWLNFGEFAKVMFFMLKEQLRHIALLGAISRGLIYGSHGKYDEESGEILARSVNKRDYSILREVTEKLKKVGVQVVDPSEYLGHLIPVPGVLGNVNPSGTMDKDIAYGFRIAKEIAGHDIGQTVIVRDGVVIGVEAAEGTNAVIERAGKIAGAGCVMIKAGRPQQDMRWDVPTIGMETITRLIDNKFKCLAIESGKMFFLQKQAAVQLADANSLSIVVL
ncbi:MAG: UDP-2,3-diacylglucosamine diphosphatase LpxI [Candidatus Omnitrophica bacterium]|nr:UDP-2,3-diacylglucosamine diphosphatase LpxI [Candidatus Omnitrophota bacterium]